MDRIDVTEDSISRSHVVHDSANYRQNKTKRFHRIENGTFEDGGLALVRQSTLIVTSLSDR